jgi:hypothetical protein
VQAFAQTGIIITHDPPPVYTFGEALTFQISARSCAPITGATLFFKTPHDTQPRASPAQFSSGTIITAAYTFDLTLRPLLPFIPIEYWWEIKDEAGEVLTTLPRTFFYEDNRFVWRSLTGDQVTVHWYEGDEAFGETALAVAVTGLRDANRDIGAELPGAVDIYIYASENDVREALRRVGRAWADGHADPEIGVVVTTVTPDVEARFNLGREVPHELTHLLVYQAASGRYRNVPNWLNEGLAVNNEAQPDPDLLAALNAARDSNTLIPLSSLCEPFPLDRAQAALAYAESASVVSYIRKAYGPQGLTQLLKTYAEGADCEGGVQRALNISLADLESAWRRDELKIAPGALQQLAALAPWLVLAALVLLAGALFLILTARAP